MGVRAIRATKSLDRVEGGEKPRGNVLATVRRWSNRGIPRTNLINRRYAAGLSGIARGIAYEWSRVKCFNRQETNAGDNKACIKAKRIRHRYLLDIYHLSQADVCFSLRPREQTSSPIGGYFRARPAFLSAQETAHRAWLGEQKCNGNAAWRKMRIPKMRQHKRPHKFPAAKRNAQIFSQR